MCCTVHSQLLCGKVGASLTLDLTCSLLGLKASGLAPDNQWYTRTVSTHAFVKMKDIIFCQHNKISHWFTITSDNFFFFKSTLNVSRSTSPLVYSTKIQYTRRLIDIAVIRGHCLAKARSISILTVRLWVWLAAVHQAEPSGTSLPFDSSVSMPVVWLESLGDLQRDRDSSTFVLEQINTVQKLDPTPSESSTNSLMSAGSSPSTNLQRQHSKQP